MAIIREPVTQFILGDPDSPPFSDAEIQALPNHNKIMKALASMILSASGWRKVFAPDGEEGSGAVPVLENRLLATAMGAVFADWLKVRINKKSPTILVALDTRPTGPAIALLLIRALLAKGCKVRYAFITAAPELMSRAGNDAEIDAFAYVSASHNPIGHNGIKFGIGGGVIGGSDAKDLISLYRKTLENPNAALSLSTLVNRLPEGSAAISDVFKAVPAEKKLCLQYYKDFLNQIAGGPGSHEEREATRKALAEGLRNRPLSIMADMNGSARTLSVDKHYFDELGAGFLSFNDKARQIAHAIIPEGASLEPCQRALEDAQSRGEAALLGYVPDCDGDRGNLVIWDDKSRSARILEAQDVFALSALSEFACDAWSRSLSPTAHSTGEQVAPTGNPDMPRAIVVNGPTSLRVHAIAGAYGAEVFEAEVGEANVVNRAEELRAAGYQVRLLGEGSNGGTITHPAAVRDPLNTLTAFLKLLRIASTADQVGPFEDWCRRIGRPELYRKDFGPADILSALPEFTTTPASHERAIMRIESTDHGALKEAWETLFLMEWSRQAGAMEKAYGFHSWEAINNEGTSSRLGLGPGSRSGAQTGGLKILFRDKNDNPVGFIWMRGSGTEPVFRVMAEVPGRNPAGEAALVAWQRALVAEADRRACGITGGSAGGSAGRLSGRAPGAAVSIPDPV